MFDPTRRSEALSLLMTWRTEQAALWRENAMNAADPDKPTGPPPAFEVTPIERLQERRFPKPVEGPDLSGDPQDEVETGVEGESKAETEGAPATEPNTRRVDLKL